MIWPRMELFAYRKRFPRIESRKDGQIRDDHRTRATLLSRYKNASISMGDEIFVSEKAKQWAQEPGV